LQSLTEWILPVTFPVPLTDAMSDDNHKRPNADELTTGRAHSTDADTARVQGRGESR
jgi:hypothetical protein